MTDDKTRAEFQEAMKSKHGFCESDFYPTIDGVPGDGDYESDFTEGAWKGWQAAKERYGQWLPIESAPKDGSHIIVCKIGLTHDTRGHDPRSDEWKRIVFEEEPTVVSVWWVSSARFENGKWRWSGETLCEPTHWMPIPCHQGAEA